MRYVVTGAAGFIGSHLAEALTEAPDGTLEPFAEEVPEPVAREPEAARD